MNSAKSRRHEILNRARVKRFRDCKESTKISEDSPLSERIHESVEAETSSSTNHSMEITSDLNGRKSPDSSEDPQFLDACSAQQVHCIEQPNIPDYSDGESSEIDILSSDGEEKSQTSNKEGVLSIKNSKNMGN